MKRIELVPAFGIKTIYCKKNKPKEKLDISCFNNIGQHGNYIVPDMFCALKKLNKAVEKEGGTMYVIDLFRDWDTQAKGRKLYETKKKEDFVAKPGNSFHNAGRAVDIAVNKLNYSDTDKNEWLQKFWDQCKPLGFHPIIKIPELETSESWHFDFPGKVWDDAYKSLPYAEVAKCAVLDVGKWDPGENIDKIKNMFVQSQLIRLGYYSIGKVDGIIGPKTRQILSQYYNSDIENFIKCFTEL